MRTLADYLPAILCLLPLAATVAGGVVAWSRRRRTDTIGWAPAVGTIVDSERVWHRGELWTRLQVEFRCLQGRTVRFIDEVPAWQVPHADVHLIYDPVSPEHARLVRRRR
ncbi:DUF3592 domain-containing protein [Hamadaea sp. NPDC050747]|uniref:DUF3592 domain-containing protein n=1 Tax=Hamadaea sp. NPDC050747 TaxID=3155789 RepID=UPI00340FE95C